MIEESLYINRYMEQRLLTIQFGTDYLANLANVIPRWLWPSKPEIGVDYAILRGGFHQGVLTTTFSRGIIGQVFSIWLVVWTDVSRPDSGHIGGWVCRLPQKGCLSLRICTVLVCLGTLPNLGRDITLFALWPVIIGRAGTFVYEYWGSSITGRQEEKAMISKKATQVLASR